MLSAPQQLVVVVGPDQEPETIQICQVTSAMPVMPARKQEVHVKTTLFLAFYTLAQFASSEPLYKGESFLLILVLNYIFTQLHVSSCYLLLYVLFYLFNDTRVVINKIEGSDGNPKILDPSSFGCIFSSQKVLCHFGSFLKFPLFPITSF